VQIPDEAESAMLALRLADDRMYAHKDGRRASARHQARSVLLGLMREREPEGGNPGCDPEQARYARCRRVAVHAPTHDHR
jgi:hypothetical protein